MAVVHYIHYEKNWYYWIDDSEALRPYNLFIDNFGNVVCGDNTTWFAGEDYTEKKVKALLREKFPNDKIMKAISYHVGHRGLPHYGTRIATYKPCIDENGNNVYRTRATHKNDKKRIKPRKELEKAGSRPIKCHSKRNRNTIRKPETLENVNGLEFR